MLARLYTILAVFSLATVLALGGLAGYLAATGHLSAQRVATLAAALRGDLESSVHTAGTPTSAPASQPAHPVAHSPEDVRKQREREQLQAATAERAAADLEARQRLVDQTLAHLVQEQEKLEQGKKEWEAQRQKLTESARDDGFKRELMYLAKLTPKLAKEHVVRTWKKHKADAVRLFMALDPGKGQKILEELKSGEDLEILHELLEQLRLQDIDGMVSGSRRIADDTPE